MAHGGDVSGADASDAVRLFSHYLRDVRVDGPAGSSTYHLPVRVADAGVDWELIADRASGAWAITTDDSDRWGGARETEQHTQFLFDSHPRVQSISMVYTAPHLNVTVVVDARGDTDGGDDGAGVIPRYVIDGNRLRKLLQRLYADNDTAAFKADADVITAGRTRLHNVKVLRYALGYHFVKPSPLPPTVGDLALMVLQRAPGGSGADEHGSFVDLAATRVSLRLGAQPA